MLVSLNVLTTLNLKEMIVKNILPASMSEFSVEHKLRPIYFQQNNAKLHTRDTGNMKYYNINNNTVSQVEQSWRSTKLDRTS